MNEDESVKKYPVSTVRFGMGKEIQLFSDEFVVIGLEEGHESRVPLDTIRRLILIPGDPTPSKLILMADLTDDTTIILVDGLTNARGFRAMLPHMLELSPDLELDPSDMGEQLRQALNTRRAWTLTCYGAILLVCIFLYVLYLVVVYIGSIHH